MKFGIMSLDGTENVSFYTSSKLYFVPADSDERFTYRRNGEQQLQR